MNKGVFNPPSLRFLAATSAAVAISQTTLRSGEAWRDNLLLISEEDLTLVVSSLVNKCLLTPVLVKLFQEVCLTRKHTELLRFFSELNIAAGIVITGSTTCRG